MEQPSFNPKLTAELGEKIYQEKYQKEYEEKYPGMFVVIDVTTSTAYLGDSPEIAFQSARKEARGPFHLIKVGASGAFHVSYTAHATLDWIFQ